MKKTDAKKRGDMAKSRELRMFPKRAIHVDFHTMPGVYDVGRDFNGMEFAETLKKAQVDYVTVFARCNQGFAYYPTKVGTVHPGLKRDLLGEIVKACHARGIQVAAYFNAGLSEENALRHREWCRVSKTGSLYEEGLTHGFRRLCFNTGYSDHLLAMTAEVLELYPVDGLFMDSFMYDPCYGVECIEGMRRLGMDINDDVQARRFCEMIMDQFAEKATALARKKNKNIKLLFNCLPYSQQPDHVELEFCANGLDWGYDYVPWIIRYVRTLGKPYLLMSARFHVEWGDFGGLRPLHSLLFDCYTAIANGATCMVGDHMHPRGKLDPAVYAMIGSAYSKIRELEPWTDGARAEAEIAVVHPECARYPGKANVKSAFFPGVAGATRLLRELKQQFDVCDGAEDLGKYKVIVLPDDVLLTEQLRKKLENHLHQGGGIISSAWAGLKADRSGFALPSYDKIVYEGDEPFKPAYFKVKSEVANDMPDMLTAIYDSGIAMRTKKGAKTLADLYQPYFNHGSWDWRYENYYTPPEKASGRPALAQSGNIYHFSFPAFRSYYQRALPAYRSLVKNCLQRLLPEPLVTAEGLPSFGQVTVTRNKQYWLVHLFNYVPELRGRKNQLIEETIVSRDVKIGLRIPGRKIVRVYCAPSKIELDYKYADGYAQIHIPEIAGYQMVVVECQR